jgi:arylsulfatase A-like enzyme
MSKITLASITSRRLLHGPSVSAVLTAIAAIAAMTATAAITACAPKPAQPFSIDGYRCSDCNVLLISIDTLRANHLGVYGSVRATSPNIDRFAQDAVTFDNSIDTGGGTLPVHMSMFTGLPYRTHDVNSANPAPLAPERVTLTNQLKAAGYDTRAFTGGGFVVASYGFGRGFNSYFAGANFETTMPMVDQYLDHRPPGRFFIFLHTYDVHSGTHRLPYEAPGGYNEMFTGGYHGTFDGCQAGRCGSDLLASWGAELVGAKIKPNDLMSPEDLEYMVGLYDGAIAYVDHELGGLFSHLKRLGLYDKTLIIVTGDHGEEFFDHGLVLHHQNFDETARTPLLIHLPRGVAAGRRTKAMVSTVDLMPTILDVVGIQPNREVMGHSLMPVIAGGPGRDGVYVASAVEKWRTQDWSLFFLGDAAVWLFDLKNDPGEKKNVLHQHEDITGDLLRHALAERWHDVQMGTKLANAKASHTAPTTPAEEARLRALGYASH